MPGRPRSGPRSAASFLLGGGVLPLVLLPLLVPLPARGEKICTARGCFDLPAGEPVTLPPQTLGPGQTAPCVGGQCFAPFQGLPDLTQTPLGQGFRPGGDLAGQPATFVTNLLRVPLFLSSVLASVIAQQLLQSLFGPGGPDLLRVSPRDPRGQEATRAPSLRARRGKPPPPHPGDFPVERLEQRKRVEERPAGPERIGPTETTCPGGVCPLPPPPPPAPIAPPAPPSGSCPGGVCPRR